MNLPHVQSNRAGGADMARRLLSVVVPVYNEVEVVPAFHARLAPVLAALTCRAEIIYVNDGSTDATLAALAELRRTDARVAVLDLSRNFGKEIALTAGLDRAAGDAVVVIDCDLQDPPELIPDLVREWWAGGYDVVYGQRASRDGDTWLKRATAHAFYRVMRHFGRVRIPMDVGDFRLLSRRAVAALQTLREQHRFMKGLFAWIGFDARAVPYRRAPRAAGHGKWSYWRLWNLAIEGFTSFTVGPLKVATYMGLTVAGLAFAYGLFVVYKTIVFGEPVAGYPSLMVAVLFLGGVQLLALGVIGEYLGRVFNESKQRPLYFVKSFAPAGASDSPSQGPRNALQAEPTPVGVDGDDMRRQRPDGGQDRQKMPTAPDDE